MDGGHWVLRKLHGSDRSSECYWACCTKSSSPHRANVSWTSRIHHTALDLSRSNCVSDHTQPKRLPSFRMEFAGGTLHFAFNGGPDGHLYEWSVGGTM